MRSQRKQRGGKHNCSECTSDGFIWAGVGNKFSMTKQVAANVCKNVIQFYGEDDEQKDGPIVPIVRHVAKVPERASEKSKAQHPQTDALDVALRLIRDQSTNGN